MADIHDTTGHGWAGLHSSAKQNKRTPAFIARCVSGTWCRAGAGRVWRLLQFGLHTREHNTAVAVGKLAGRHLTAADHEWMRKHCQTGVEFVKAEQEPTEIGTKIFTVSMCVCGRRA